MKPKALVVLSIILLIANCFTSFFLIENCKASDPCEFYVDDERVNKAEFYVDGILKNTIAEAPYIWRWDEKAFLKHTIETRVYDQDGNSSSTGEMMFFVFNLPKFFK